MEISTSPVSPGDARKFAEQLEAELAQIGNGERKAGNVSLEAIARLIQFARDNSSPPLPDEDPCEDGHKEYASWQYDAQGIELCKTCEACHAFRMSKYRPEILTGYSQRDVDEPIEPE